jgi:hypothetical protein
MSHLFNAGNKFEFVLFAVHFDQFHYKREYKKIEMKERRRRKPKKEESRRKNENNKVLYFEFTIN